jgi:hypothetical protein
MQKDKYRESNLEYANYMSKKAKKKSTTAQKFFDSRNQSVTEYVSVKRDLYGLKRQDFESTAQKLEEQRMAKSFSVMSRIDKESRRVDEMRYIVNIQTEGARISKVNENELKSQLQKDCQHVNNKLNTYKRKDFFSGKQVNLFSREGIAGHTVITLT